MPAETPADPEYLRFMILDDETIIALDLADMLHDLGHSVVAMVNRVAVGIEFATHGVLDMAILDINVHGVASFPLARILQDRGVPIIFASGYGGRGLIDGFRDALFLTKPYSIDDLKKVVAKARIGAV